MLEMRWSRKPGRIGWSLTNMCVYMYVYIYIYNYIQYKYQNVAQDISDHSFWVFNVMFSSFFWGVSSCCGLPVACEFGISLFSTAGASLAITLGSPANPQGGPGGETSIGQSHAVDQWIHMDNPILIDDRRQSISWDRMFQIANRAFNQSIDIHYIALWIIIYIHTVYIYVYVYIYIP